MIASFIVIWKDTKTGEIITSEVEHRSKKFVKSIYNNENLNSKLLYLLRIKFIKNGKLSIPKLQK